MYLGDIWDLELSLFLISHPFHEQCGSTIVFSPGVPLWAWSRESQVIVDFVLEFFFLFFHSRNKIPDRNRLKRKYLLSSWCQKVQFITLWLQVLDCAAKSVWLTEKMFLELEGMRQREQGGTYEWGQHTASGDILLGLPFSWGPIFDLSPLPNNSITSCIHQRINQLIRSICLWHIRSHEIKLSYPEGVLQ